MIEYFLRQQRKCIVNNVQNLLNRKCLCATQAKLARVKDEIANSQRFTKPVEQEMFMCHFSSVGRATVL